MGFRYTEAFAELQPGDLRGVRELYGPAIDSDTLAIGSDSALIETPAAGEPTIN